MNRCGIKHKFGDQTCIREKGHEGLCWSRAERCFGGRVERSLWNSKDGEYDSHVGYETIFPINGNVTSTARTKDSE